MKVDRLLTLLRKNNIPFSVKMMSDSGRECDATEMNGVYYNSKINTIVFTQLCDKYDKYYNDPDWKILT